jgi:hypothetical protein
VLFFAALRFRGPPSFGGLPLAPGAALRVALCLATTASLFLRLDRVSWYPLELLKPMGVKLNSIGMKYVSAWSEWFTAGTPLPEGLAEAQPRLLAPYPHHAHRHV